MKKHLALWCSVLFIMVPLAFPKESVRPAAELTGQIDFISKNKVYINLGSSDGIKPGMVLVVYHVLDSGKDQSGEEVAGEPVAEISVVEVKEKASTCIVVTKLSAKYGIAVHDIVKPK